MNRRDALRTLIAAGTGAAIGRSFSGASDGPERIMRPIPKTGETLPVIGLGTSKVFDVGSGERDRAAVKGVLTALAQAGGHLVDSSPMYGRTEGVVGDLVEASGLRSRLFLASKVWTTGHDAGLAQIESSLRIMGGGRM